MTEAQVAVNGTALRNLAARLERLGYTGESYAEAEHIALNLLSDGYRPVEKPPPLRGTGASERARTEALAATAEAVDRARREREGKP